VYARHYVAYRAHLGEHGVRGFLLLLAELGRKASTLVVYHAALRFLYLFTLRRPEVVEGIPRPQVPRSPVRRPLTHDEARTLLEAAEAKPYVHAFIATALATGMRLNELCNLRVEDIDAGSGTIHVREGKGGKRRRVKLDGRLLELLRRYWRDERLEGSWLFPAQRMLSPFVVDPVHRWSDRPVSSSGAHSRLKNVAKRSGLKRNVTHHDLRRTWATWPLEAGVDLRVVQVLLGHDGPETTTRYTQVRGSPPGPCCSGTTTTARGPLLAPPGGARRHSGLPPGHPPGPTQRRPRLLSPPRKAHGGGRRGPSPGGRRRVSRRAAPVAAIRTTL
jgi:integrase/recombinase XerD